MLERVWRKWKPLALFMGMQIDTTSRENSMEIQLGIKLAYNPAIPLLGIYPEETIIERGTYTLLFTAALFTMEAT